MRETGTIVSLVHSAGCAVLIAAPLVADAAIAFTNFSQPLKAIR